MRLELSQLIMLAGNAGFTGDDLITAVSIALAESGGDPNAYNPERAAGAPEGMGSFGLWQIYRKAHPEYAGVNLFDPQANAAAAFAVYSAAGNSFRPWSTFKNSAYLAHVDAVSAAMQANMGSGDAVAADASSADGSSVDAANVDGSSGPDPTTLVTIVAGAGLLVWLASRFING